LKTLKGLNSYKLKIKGGFLLCLFLSIILNAQPGIISEKSLSSKQKYVIKVWNSENGLPQNSILACLQTSDGYLWISTEEGLVRFDGNIYKSYNTFNTTNLPSNSFKYMFEDSRQTLWLVSLQNKLVSYKNGVFQTITTKEGITSICENKEGGLIVSSTLGNIYKLHNEQLSLLASLKNLAIYKLLFAKQKDLYIATNKGLWLFRNNQLAPCSEIKNREALCLNKDENGTVWAYGHKGLYKVEDTTCIPLHLPKEIADIKYFNDFLIRNENNYCVATNYGVFVIENGLFQLIDINSGLSSNTSSIVYRDKENNLWVGTANAGINKLKAKTILTYNKEDGLRSDGCGPLLTLNDGSILISNYCNGLSNYNNKGFSLFNQKHVGCIWSMLQDKENNLWLGTYNQGLFKYKNLDSTNYFSKTNVSKNVYFSIFQDADDKIWFGTANGMSIYKNGAVVSVFEKTIQAKVSYMMQDNNRNIWVCTDSGLVVIVKNIVKTYTTNDGLPSNKIRHVYQDKEGTMWISTYDGGIVRFKNNSFFVFNKSENIMDGFTSCIIEDDDNNLWISSNRGIYCASKKSLNDYADSKSLFMNLRYFGKEDGMKNSECNGGFQYAGIKMADGKIMFPTVNGVALINPKIISENNYIPKVIIQSVVADDVFQNIYDSIFTINNDTRKIEINFTAPFFGDSKNLLFEYKLEGYDLEWHQPDYNRTVSYSNLPPGDYVFKIGVYGYVDTQNISIRILSPFWKTGKFYILLAVFCTLLFFIIVYFRTKKIRKKEALNTQINKQYAALELKALQGQMNPHFMFNCLNSIKYFITTDNKTSANKYLGKFSKLIRLFLEHANSNTIPLSEEVHILSLYVEMEQLRLDNSFEFQLNIDPKINLKDTEIPAMLLQPFVENAIHHGLRNHIKKGILTLSIIFENDLLKITIDDNGVGRKKSAELKQLSAKEHTSMGTKLAQERIETLNYIKNTYITLEIIDKVNSQVESEGTRIIITIPNNN
jgi:ligand-binding sensor domain-containing protein